MNVKQKIKKIILICWCMIICSLSLVFHNVLNSFFVNMFVDNFKIVSSDNNLLVHFINVDQADATAINLPDGKIMLIDSGCENFNVTYYKYLKSNVINTQRGNYIDYLVLTHADMDHVGGTLKLIQNFNIGLIYLPSIESKSEGYQEILDCIEEKCQYKMLKEEFIISNSGYEFRFFKQLNDTNTNDASQVIKLTYKNMSFLFAGDISQRVEEKYVDFYGNALNSDVLKVSHHGSKTASSDKFLDAVRPKNSIISVGKNNDYGHPSDEVVKRLESVGSKVWRTDKDGNILSCVGDEYGLKIINNKFTITSLSLDYAYLVVFVDTTLVIAILVVVVKRPKKNR